MRHRVRRSQRERWLSPARSTEDRRGLEEAWGHGAKLGTLGAWQGGIWDFHAWVTQTYTNPLRKLVLTANHKLLAFHLRFRRFFSFLPEFSS